MEEAKTKNIVRQTKKRTEEKTSQKKLLMSRTSLIKFRLPITCRGQAFLDNLRESREGHPEHPFSEVQAMCLKRTSKKLEKPNSKTSTEINRRHKTNN